MKRSGVGADERPVVVEVEDEEGDFRRDKKNVCSGSRAGRPKKKFDSRLMQAKEKVLNTEERIERALQKGSDEGSDDESVGESISEDWQGNDYAEHETGATFTNAKNRHGPE